MVSIGNSWDEILKDEFSGENYLKIREFLKDEYSHHVCYPSMYDIFNALKYTDYYAVKAVIIGQDPYHEEGQAHGLSFSVKKGVDIPPSLVNIYKELKSDLGISPAPHGCLESWAKQGVLLLNSVLTVRAHLANSHKNCGWQIFTDDIIKKLNERDTPIVFILWGETPVRKSNILQIRYITLSKAHIQVRFLHTTVFSAASRFQGRTSFWKKTVSRRSNGKLRIDERKNRAVVQGCRQKN